MTLKLNAGLSRKVADGNYGSRGASVNLELELDTELVNDPPKLQEKIKKLFNVVRTSLDEELNGGYQSSTEVKPAAPSNGNGNGYVQRGGKRQATPNQVKAIYAIAHNRQIDLNQFLNERFHVSQPNDLTIKDASTAIDALKSDEDGRAA